MLADKAVQNAPVSKSRGGRGKIGGIRAACRELGLERTNVIRALKIASLSKDAKQVARETGLDDNRSVLLKAANEPTSEAQVHYLQMEYQRRKTPIDKAEREFQNLLKTWQYHLKVWNAVCPSVRERFHRYLVDQFPPPTGPDMITSDHEPNLQDCPDLGSTTQSRGGKVNTSQNQACARDPR